MEAQILKRLFSVDEFHQMADAGVFGEDASIRTGRSITSPRAGRSMSTRCARSPPRSGRSIWLPSGVRITVAGREWRVLQDVNAVLDAHDGVSRAESWPV